MVEPKNNPLKSVLFLVPGFPKNEEDSTCIPALQQYVYHFAKLNPDIHIGVVAFQYPYRKRKYKWNGINIYPCGGRGKRRFYRLFTWLLVIYRVVQFHLKFKISVIHSFWLAECAFLGQFLSTFFQVKHIASTMGQDVLPSNLYLKLMNFSHMIVTVPSKNAANTIYNSTTVNVNTIIPIGLDVDNFEAEQKKSERKIDILGVGSLIPLKNYKMFINIINKLSKRFPQINAVIIGYGEEYYPLEQMIIDNGLEDNIELFGKLSRQETIEYFYQSKIFLHTSRYESLGYVFLEALYCGLTVVCFDVGIAKSQKKIHVCTDEDEMFATLKRLLSKKSDHQPVLLKSIVETVHEFKQLYST